VLWQLKFYIKSIFFILGTVTHRTGGLPSSFDYSSTNVVKNSPAMYSYHQLAWKSDTSRLVVGFGHALPQFLS
jgi:hypothetical protein